VAHRVLNPTVSLRAKIFQLTGSDIVKDIGFPELRGKLLGEFRRENENGRIIPAIEIVTGSGVVTVPIGEIVTFKGTRSEVKEEGVQFRRNSLAPIVSPQSAPARSPSDTVQEFYKAMREKRFREAFDMSIYKPAIDGLKPQEFEDLQPDFEKTAPAVPTKVEITGEQISGDMATVFVKVPIFVKVPRGEEPSQLEPVSLMRVNGQWIIGDRENQEIVKKAGNRFFFNARIATEAVQRPPSTSGLAGAQEEGLKWHKDLRGDVDEATRLAQTDPVSAALLCKDVLQGGKKPTAEQRVWLTQQIASLRPRAMEILEGDYDRAAKAKDVRGMVVAGRAAVLVEQIGATIVGFGDLTVTEEIQKMLEGGGGAALWNISEVSATFSKGYRESVFSVIVPKGSHVLRVKARVENANEATDPEYVLYAMGRLKRIGVKATTEPHRWIDESFVFLTAGAGPLIRPAAIARGSDLITMQVTSRAGQTFQIVEPKALKKGESVVLDAVFVVPLEAKELKLVVLGAAPLELSPAAREK